MEFLPYNDTFKTSCLEIFDSNLGKFFAPEERIEFAEFLDRLSPTDEYYVGTLQQRVVACGGLARDQGCGVLCWGMVRRDYHSRGLGNELTVFRLERLKSLDNIDLIKIETSQHTQGFYAKQGFHVTRVEKGGFGPGIDCVAMALTV